MKCGGLRERPGFTRRRTAKSYGNGPCAGPGLWPRPRPLPRWQGRVAGRRSREGKDFAGTTVPLNNFFFSPLLANIVILYINTKCQNVSQLNGSLASAQKQADKRQNYSLQKWFILVSGVSTSRFMAGRI